MTKKRAIARLDFCVLMERGSVCSSSILAQFCAKVIAVDSCNQASITYPNSNGATMVASLSITNFGVSIFSLPQVIFSFGGAPE